MPTIYQIDLPAFKATLDELVADYARQNSRHPRDAIFYHGAMSGLSAIMTLMRNNNAHVYDNEFEQAYDEARAAMKTIFNPGYQPTPAQEAACSSPA